MLPSLIFTSGIAASRLRAATTQELFGVNTYPAIFMTDATDAPDRKWREGGREPLMVSTFPSGVNIKRENMPDWPSSHCCGP